jgi:hypothetical protein
MITLSHRRIRIILYGLVLSNIMAGVEGTIVATARPFIVADLGRFDLSAWMFVSYQLTQAISTNLWGKFSDLFGRKRLYQLSLDDGTRSFPPLKTDVEKDAGDLLGERIEQHVLRQIEQAFTAEGESTTFMRPAVGGCAIAVAVLVVMLLTALAVILLVKLAV